MASSVAEENGMHPSRLLYTPTQFARSSLLHLQEVGKLAAASVHTSSREHLNSYLCFVVADGSESLTYDDKTYTLQTGDVTFIDCR